MTLKQELEHVMRRAEEARYEGNMPKHRRLMERYKRLEDEYLRLRAKGKQQTKE